MNADIGQAMIVSGGILLQPNRRPESSPRQYGRLLGPGAFLLTGISIFLIGEGRVAFYGLLAAVALARFLVLGGRLRGGPNQTRARPSAWIMLAAIALCVLAVLAGLLLGVPWLWIFGNIGLVAGLVFQFLWPMPRLR